MAYSSDYRELALRKLSEGNSVRAVAQELKMSTNTLQRWKRHRKRKKRLSYSRKINDNALRKDVERYPDDYQRERSVRFNCSQRAIGIALKRLGITRKKELKHPKAEKNKREIFSQELRKFQQEGRPIVYLDESGFKGDDYRNYGYTIRGEKCFDHCNWQAKNQTNVIGAIYKNKLFSVGLFDNSITGIISHEWGK